MTGDVINNLAPVKAVNKLLDKLNLLASNETWGL